MVVGIVEEFNGQIHEIRPKNIKFLDYDIIVDGAIMDPIEKGCDEVLNELKTILKIGV